jgi:hypothetical protein
MLTIMAGSGACETAPAGQIFKMTMPPPPATIVVFDIGNVLLHWDPRLLYRKIFADEAETEWFLWEVYQPAFNLELDRGHPFREAFADLSARFPDYAEEPAPMTSVGSRPSLDRSPAVWRLSRRFVAMVSETTRSRISLRNKSRPHAAPFGFSMHSTESSCPAKSEP